MPCTHICWACVMLSILYLHGSTVNALYGHENPAENMVKNWGFEADLDSTADWRVILATSERLPQAAHDGSSYGVKISGRSHKDAGVRQRIYFGSATPGLVRGRDLYFSAFIKFATNPNPPQKYIRAKYMVKVVYADAVNNYQGAVGRLGFERADGKWYQVGGDLAGAPLDRPEPLYIDIFMRVEPFVDVDYYLDSFALTKIDHLGDDWKTTLRLRINANRRTNVRMVTRLPSSIEASSTRFIIKMIRHKFNWGTSIGRGHLAGTGKFNTNLKKFLKESMFNWLCYTSAMNWRHMETRMNDPDLHTTKVGTDWMLANGFKPRGHSMLWEIMESNPGWLHGKTGQVMKDHVMRRVEYMANNWKDEMYEWDTCNEFLHQRFYEERAGVLDKSLLIEEFQRAHAIDPKAKLCINDYSVLRDGQYTSAQANLGMQLLELNVSVSCMGAQGHMRWVDHRSFSIERFLKRLAIIGAAGLPISVTELSVHADNDTARADILERIMYSIYSDPLVTGAILWGVSDMPGLVFAEDTSLVHGINFEPNKAGEVLKYLLTNLWTSRANYKPRRRYYGKTLYQLYHGTYELTMYVNNKVHDVRTFDVGPTVNGGNERIVMTFTP